MSDAANRVVVGLNTDIQEERTFNENKTPGVTPARFYDKVSFNKNEKTGKFSKSTSRIETNTKDNVVQTNELIQKAQLEVSDYTKLARVVDEPIYNNLVSINQKKQQIRSLITEGIGAGCSTVVSVASSMGVMIGVGSYIHADSVTISKYNNLSNFGADDPFSSESEVDLTQGNLGTGYKTNELDQNFLTEDEQEEYEDYGTLPVGYGQYRRFTGLLADGFTASTTCAGYATSIGSLFAEINDHRQQINNYNAIRGTVRQIKEKKTEKELNLWSLQHDSQKMSAQANSDTQLRDTIINEPIFGYRANASSPATLEFIAGLDAGSITVGTYVPTEGGYYIGTVQYSYASWETNSGQTPTYHIFVAPKDIGEKLLQYKTDSSADGTPNDTAPQSRWDGYWNTYQSVLANAGSAHPAFQFAQNANINGKTDWYFGANEEINYAFRNVLGVSSDTETPSLSSHQNNPFDPGGTEGIPLYVNGDASTTYWSSTEYSGNTAQAYGSWRFALTNWTDFGANKIDTRRVRLIRRVLASS